MLLASSFFLLNQIRPIYRSLSPTMTILSIMHFFALPDTDPGCKKQGTRLVRDVMRRGPVSFTFEEKELFARHHSHQMVGKTCCDMGVCGLKVQLIAEVAATYFGYHSLGGDWVVCKNTNQQKCLLFFFNCASEAYLCVYGHYIWLPVSHT